MPPLARKPQQIYINRNIDFIIENHIKEKTSKLLFVHGQGGVGKSTLLKKFLSYDAEEIPTVLINLQNTESTNFIDILLSRNITTIKNCKNFEKIRKIIIEDDPHFFASILEVYGSEISTQLTQVENESYGLVVSTFYDMMKLISKFFRRSHEKKKKDISHNIEFALLDALLKDFKNYGLFMLDTLEKTKNIDIKSRVEFQDEELFKSHQEKSYQFKHYINGLIKLLVPRSTFLVAGRNSQDELNMEVPLDYTDELSLETFSTSNIKNLFSIHVKRDKKLSMPSDKHIEHILELTNGNPLLVGLFPKVAKEYNSWDELDYKEMERRIKTDDTFGLLFYMTDRVLSHLDKSTDIWKLVIPRVLNKEIEELLFKDEKIFKELIEVGLATKGIGKDSERYYLHDDVHRAIVAYYERKFNGGFSSWHDADDVAELHRELMEFYEIHSELHGANSAFEKCYHKMMLMNGCEEKFAIERRKLSKLYLSSINLSSQNKIEYCQNIENWINKEIIEALDNDNQNYRKYMSEKLFKEITEALFEGTIKTSYDIDFLKKLKKNGLDNDASLYFYLGSSYFNQKKYDESLNFYNKSLQHIKYLHKKYPSYIYNNMGLLYAKQNNHKEALTYYKKALEIDENKLNVYINLITTYEKLNKFDKSINSYEKALKINPQNSDIYINMSESYGRNKRYKESIKVYIDAIKIMSTNTEIYSRLYWMYINYFQYELNKKQPFEQKLEAKYIELFQNKKETFIHYEMLRILQNIVQNKEISLEKWVHKYHGVGMGGFSFDELDKWIDKVDNRVLKARSKEALKVFKGHD